MERYASMVGGGIRQENIQEIALRTGATEFHSSLRTRTDSLMAFRNHALKLGSVGDEFARFVVLEKSVRGLRDALGKIADGTSEGLPN
ncbi:MAG TPA: copper homeostasis protein CutC [Acidobacteriaceae bacterium]|nr:copper homeostasis protein CutC [Terriglobia bacterium]HVC89953.1 copper homeostasis protein CutC [Acidobacteriaceae bacterium]